MIYPTQRFRLMVLAISVSGFFGFSAVGPSDRFAHAAEVKPAWQEEWEKVLAAAKKEGQVTVYISGYEAVLPVMFEKCLGKDDYQTFLARAEELDDTDYDWIQSEVEAKVMGVVESLGKESSNGTKKSVGS